MTKDRLKELKSMQAEPEDIELSMYKPGQDQVDNFLRESDELEKNMNKMKSIVEEIKELHESILVSSDTDNNLRGELDERMNEIKTNAFKIRQNIKAMSEMILKEERESNRVTVELKIKKTRIQFLSKKFSDIMKEYNLIQANYRDDCKKRIQRQLEITGRDADDDEIEEMLESKNPQIFTQGIISETMMAKKALEDIEARHKDIIMLEKNILELHEMFTDLADLVNTQGEMVNNIEKNMETTNEEVKDGKESTAKAVVNVKKVRKKKLIIGLIIAAVIIIIIILVVVLLSVYLK